jgi:hypothetical protein
MVKFPYTLNTLPALREKVEYLSPNDTEWHSANAVFTVTVIPALMIISSVDVGVEADPATPSDVAAHIAPSQFPLLTAYRWPNATIVNVMLRISIERNIFPRFMESSLYVLLKR